MHLNYTILYNAVPVLIGLIVIESVFLMKEKREDKKNFISSIAIALLNVPFSTITNLAGLYLYTFIYHFRICSISPHSWIAWIFLVFADELSYYWFHRISHQTRLLWASHKVHHSSQKFTLTSGLRVLWTGGLTGSFLFWAWLPFFGIMPFMVLFADLPSIISLIGCYIRSSVKGFFRKKYDIIFIIIAGILINALVSASPGGMIFSEQFLVNKALFEVKSLTFILEKKIGRA